MERCDIKCKEILRKEYADYDKNSWHYEREFGMLLKAYKEGAQEIHDLVREKLASSENSGLHKHFVTNRTYKCSRCGTEYIPASGTVKAGCCIMPVDYRTSGICGGELIEVT